MGCIGLSNGHRSDLMLPIRAKARRPKSLRDQAKKDRTGNERQPAHQCVLSISWLLGMLPKHTPDGTRDHVEEPASNMCEQYTQPERGSGIHQVEPKHASNNCHALHSERPRDRFLAVNSRPEE